jgi:hypothetical protein
LPRINVLILPDVEGQRLVAIERIGGPKATLGKPQLAA